MLLDRTILRTCCSLIGLTGAVSLGAAAFALVPPNPLQISATVFVVRYTMVYVCTYVAVIISAFALLVHSSSFRRTYIVPRAEH